MAKETEMPILSRQHFYDLLESGQEEFRIELITPGAKGRKISEDAPFDKDDPMSYVLVELVYDYINIYAKGTFTAHDIAESQNKYGTTKQKPLMEQVKDLTATVNWLCPK